MRLKYNDPAFQLDDSKIYLGILEDGDIAPYAVNKIFKGVESFYECAISYALFHLPLDDEILHTSRFVDVEKRFQADFTQVSYL